MSIHVSTLVWKIDLPMVTKLVMLKLADNANEDGSNVRPSQTTVATQCGCSVRTVQRVVKWAEDCGLIICESAPEGRVKTYRFDMELLRHSCANPRQRVRGDRESGVTESQGDPCQRVTPPLTESRPLNKNRHLTVNEPSFIVSNFPKRPSRDDCHIYATEIELSQEQCDEFFDHFESNGWKVSGRAPMKDWRAAMRNWKRNVSRFARGSPKLSNSTLADKHAQIMKSLESKHGT